MPRKFDPALKERAVRMVAEQVHEVGTVTKACEVVGARLGVGKETVRGWVPKAPSPGDGDPTVLRKPDTPEVKQLKRRIRDLEEDLEIAKKAATFFAGELDPRRR